MLYEAKLSEAETSTLRDLVGGRLDAVVSDGWAVDIVFPGYAVRVQPEEVPTPDAQHPCADVDRPIVIGDSTPIDPSDAAAIIAGGRVLAVEVLSVLLTFSPPAPGLPVPIPGVGEIPAGIDYGWVYYDPRDRHRVVSTFGATQSVVDLDVAIALRTDGVPLIVIYTHGFFCRVCAGLPDSQEWVQHRAFCTRRLAAEDGFVAEPDAP